MSRTRARRTSLDLQETKHWIEAHLKLNTKPKTAGEMLSYLDNLEEQPDEFRRDTYMNRYGLVRRVLEELVASGSAERTTMKNSRGVTSTAYAQSGSAWDVVAEGTNAMGLAEAITAWLDRNVLSGVSGIMITKKR